MTKNNLDDFAVFILTHGRPDNVITYKTIRNRGYTGPIIVVIDNEDKTRNKYVENFGDEVMIFNKAKAAQTFDEADNFDDRRAIVYARNASFQLANELGIKYFIQLDDDYTSFGFRFDSQLVYNWKSITDLDTVFLHLLNFYIDSGLTSIAIAQGGDFIGGGECNFATSVQTKRKAMNSFICSTDRPFKFIGRINEDVNTYTRLASTGATFLTVNQVSLGQVTTQTNTGGMTELYLDSGTYVKSFYSIIFHPSSIVIREMSSKHSRLHHQIKWDQTVPKIISEAHRKG